MKSPRFWWAVALIVAAAPACYYIGQAATSGAEGVKFGVFLFGGVVLVATAVWKWNRGDFHRA